MAQRSYSIDAEMAAALAEHVASPALSEMASRLWAETRASNAAAEEAGPAFIARLREEGFAFVLPALTASLAQRSPLPWALAAACECALEAGDAAGAARFAAQLEALQPGAAATLRCLAGALAASGDFAGLGALLASLPPALAQEEWALLADIALQEHRGEHILAMQAGQRLGRLNPHRPEGFLAEALAVYRLGRKDEADRGIQNVANSFPHHAPTLLAAAEIAEGRGDFEAAQSRWADMRKRARHLPTGFTHALRGLERASRMDLATPILWEGLARFPQNAELLAVAARAAEGTGQVADADAFWQRACAVQPEDPASALSAALCLMCNPATRARRMPEVLQRLKAHHRHFPDYAPAYVAHLNALREMKLSATAVKVSADWCSRFPRDAALALARAGAHEDGGDAAACLAEIAALRGRLPGVPDIEAAYVRALSLTGDYDAADAAGAAGLKAAPAALRLLLEYARVATRRGDWQGAYERLLDARRKLPNDVGLAQELQNVRLQLAEALPEARQAGAPEALTRFESLGGTGVGCEFGMVQRQLGYDAVGLLRWTQSDVAQLIDGLDSRFAGVGDPGQTILKTVRHSVDNEEYVTEDRRFYMLSHTFVRVSDAPAESMYRQTCRRLRFLRDKLLEDLASADKIFAFKASRPISDDEARALHAALRRHGDAALLCVMREDGANAAHTVRKLGRGLYAAYVTHFLNDETGLPGSDITGWQSACTLVEADWRRTRDAADEAA